MPLKHVYALTFSLTGYDERGMDDVEPSRLFYTVKPARATLHSSLAKHFHDPLLEAVYRSLFDSTLYEYPEGVEDGGAEDEEGLFDVKKAAVDALMAGEPRAEACFDLSIYKHENWTISQTWFEDGTGYAVKTWCDEAGGEHKYAWSVRKVKIGRE